MGKPFRFKLEKVLQFRRQAEEQAQQDLARARSRLREQEERLEGLLQALADHEASRFGNAEMTQADLWLWENYHRGLSQDVESSRVRRNRLAEEVERARAALIEKAKDRKVMEKLKEQQAEKHAREEQALEEKENDEVATILHGYRAF
ncbi:flagellar export protein FliJ [Desulfohalovibrio reitneri]|uniref:flagellar export protein FliJ n=1 Tax=Desulfohalovibrio reitneri TaxID=1307759 RepID=UPI0004A77CE2|nr:flagellar export protein FliJ [Desulfohalovibrio reitneri]